MPNVKRTITLGYELTKRVAQIMMQRLQATRFDCSIYMVASLEGEMMMSYKAVIPCCHNHIGCSMFDMKYLIPLHWNLSQKEGGRYPSISLLDNSICCTSSAWERFLSRSAAIRPNRATCTYNACSGNSFKGHDAKLKPDRRDRGAGAIR